MEMGHLYDKYMREAKYQRPSRKKKRDTKHDLSVLLPEVLRERLGLNQYFYKYCPPPMLNPFFSGFPYK